MHVLQIIFTGRGLKSRKSDDLHREEQTRKKYIRSDQVIIIVSLQTIIIIFMHLADAFIQSDLQLHSGYTFSLVYVFPGNRTHNLLCC